MRKKGINKMLASVIAFCLVLSMMPWSSLVALADTATDTTEKTLTLDEAKTKAKEYIDGLTINNSKNDPSTVVSTWGSQFSWDNEERETKNKDYLFEWSYYNGVVFEGLDYIYDAYQSNNTNTGTEYRDYVQEYLSAMIDEDGNWAKCSNNSSKECAGYNSTHGADCYKTASLLLNYGYMNKAATLYEDLKDAQTKYVSSDIGGNYYHTWSSEPEYAVWLDGLYMIQPFMAEYAAATGDTAELKRIVDRFDWIGKNMVDKETGLYYYAASSDKYWNNNGQYWGRAIGWYAAAMVDVMDDMSGDNLTAMKTQFQSLVDTMVKYQDNNNGMWHQFVNNSSSSIETSVTALMAYSIQKAVNNGWLDSSYAEYSQNAFKGICNEALDENGLHYICFKGSASSTAETPYSAVSYGGDYVNEGKGVGPFIMAYAEMINAVEYTENTNSENAGSESTDSENTDSEDQTTSNELVDPTTGVAVDTANATKLTVIDKTDDETVKKSLDGKLADGFKAYDITVDGYNDSEKATVKIPIPLGMSGKNIVAYYVPSTSNEEPQKINGTVDGANYVFETDHFSVYAVGESIVSGTGALVGGSIYTLDINGVDAGEKYLILDVNSGTGHALTNNNGTASSTEVKISNDTIVSDDDNIVWTFSGSQSGTIKNGSTYINLRNNINLLSNSDRNLTITRTNNTYSISRNYYNGSYYLTYDNGWKRSNNGQVYLYKYTGSSTGSEVNFSVTPSPVTLTPGETTNLTPSITIEGGTVNTSTITWATSDSTVATVEDGVVTAVADGNTTITATLTSVNGTEVQNNGITGITLEIPITVKSKTVTSAVLSGNTPVTTIKNKEPDFSKIILNVTYNDGSTEPITISNGLSIEDYDITSPGDYYAKISYLGIEYGTVKVTVEGNPYEGLIEATDYPTYPNDGAVRINKTATNGEFAFTETGITKVELDVAGISVKKGVDVVLIADVSNSMAWSLENSGGANDQEKLPTNGQKTKLENAMESASNFADILLGGNNGNASDNTLSFVTFAGYDSTFGKDSSDSNCVDSLQQVFTKVTDAESAKKSFNGTTITGTKSTANTTSATYELKITNENGELIASGNNRGDTNYDYAFWQAVQTVNDIQNQAGYAESGRETYVVFMTDGAPSHYNGKNKSGSSGRDDRLPNNIDQTYKIGNAYTQVTWYDYINGSANTYAKELYDKVNGNFVSVGFDLAHGGLGTWSWTETQLSNVLKGIAYKDDANKEVEVFATANAQELLEFYTSLAGRIAYSGTQARVTDNVKSDFDVQMAQFSTIKGSTDTLFSPKIQVTAYDLVTKSQATDTQSIGTRTGTSEVLETVTFNETGTEAYSSLIDGGKTNIMSTVDGVTKIEAFYFTYTKTEDSTEKFVWKIGNITDKEIALSYYAYLTGTMEGTRQEGVYDTNEDATLEYIDINGDYANKVFPLPKVNWGGAVTTVEYYLANEKGEPVNRMGERIPFANRIIISEGTYYKFALGETKTVYGVASGVPTGYQMSNPDAYYTVISEASGKGDLTINDDLKFTDIGTSNIMTSTQRVDTDTGSYSSTKVAFAVYTFEAIPSNPKLISDKIVIDYGKEINVDVLENDQTNLANAKCTAELVGFAKYNAATAEKDIEKVQPSAGLATFDGDYGTFSIKNGEVSYQPTKVINEVEHVYAVIKVTNNSAGNDEDVYYQYNILDIIPATMMYYETDFSSSAFTTVTTGSAWVKAMTTDNDVAADGPQNDGTIGVGQTYGYDSTYTNDKYLSNGSSYFVEGAGIKLNESSTAYTYTDFSFKGTGFDLISRTGAKQGAIRVDIYTDSARTNLAKSVTVLNKSKSNLELYQVPVVSVNNLTYGTYYVRIGVNAAYTNTNYPNLNRGGEFYFDAIRVYDPLNASSSSTTADDKLAYDAYLADNEADSQVTEVRSQLIENNQYDATVEVEGMTFVDRVVDTETGSHDVEVKTYETIGPNNEVYLQDGQAVAFKVSVDKKPSSFDIGAKSANGETANLKVIAASSLDTLKANKAVVSDVTGISTSTSLFYPVSDVSNVFVQNGNKYEAYVFITNTNTDANSILSITDIKVAYGNTNSSSDNTSDSSSDDAPAVASYFVEQEAVSFAAFCLENPEAIQPEEEPNYDIQSAEFTSSSCSIFKKATMTVTTTTDVETIKVTNKNGKEMSIDATSTVNEEGMKVWTVKFKPGYSIGTQSFTVTGYGVDGTEGASATASIKVKLF